MILLTQGIVDASLVMSVTYIYVDRNGKEVRKMLSFVAKNLKQWQLYQAALLAASAEASSLA